MRLAPTGARAYGACGWVGGEGERGRRKPSAARRPPRAQVFFVCCGKSARMHALTTAEVLGISYLYLCLVNSEVSLEHFELEE